MSFIHNVYNRFQQTFSQTGAFLTKRVIKPGPKGTEVETNIDQPFNQALASDLIDFIRDIISTSFNRKEVYNLYKRMSKDARIGAAMELIVDEASQPDMLRGKIYWVESEDDEVEKRLNAVLNTVGFDSKVPNILYHIIRDGGAIIKTFNDEFSKDEKLKGKLGLYFEVLDNYLKVQEITKYDDTIGFYQAKDEDIKPQSEEVKDITDAPDNYQATKTEDKDIIYGVKEYIHILDDRKNHREDIELTFTDPTTQERKQEQYRIRYGTSYLETLIEIFLIIDFLELLILSVRFGKSQLYRIFKIEVGSATKVETSHMINEFKQKLSSTESIDQDTRSTVISRKPIPYGKNIFISTRNGKGDFSQELVGGDINIKDLVDFDYFLNKLYAALKVPKSYLGEEEATGGLGSTSLVKLDARFARLVITYKELGKEAAVKYLENYCELTNNKEYIGKFDVKYQRPTTGDDVDRREDLSTSIELATALKELLDTMEGLNIPPEDLLEFIVGRILGLGELLPDDKEQAVQINDAENGNNLESDTLDDDESDTFDNLESEGEDENV